MFKASAANRVFSYHTIRGLVGLIALGIAVTTAVVAGQALGSISASYHTDAQDLFVGSLFIVSAFLGAYNGSPNSPRRNWWEYLSAKIASFFVFLVAIFPTGRKGCDDCVPSYIQFIAGKLGTTSSDVHSVAAVIFFVCLFVIMVVFAVRAYGKPDGFCRSILYGICCLGMLASVVFILPSRDPQLSDYGGVYWAEFFALFWFGVGWLYSGLYEWLGKRSWWLPCPLTRAAGDGVG